MDFQSSEVLAKLQWSIQFNDLAEEFLDTYNVVFTDKGITYYISILLYRAPRGVYFHLFANNYCGIVSGFTY